MDLLFQAVKVFSEHHLHDKLLNKKFSLTYQMRFALEISGLG